MLDPRIAAFQKEMDAVLAFLKNEFAKLQTGRANAALVEHIEVEAYGQRQQLRAIAGISVGDAKSILVQPWDRSVLQAVEKAIQLADTGASISNDGVAVRLSLPPMNEERRANLKKVVQKLAEEAKISVRKHRQSVHDAIKSEKDEDVKRTLMDDLQKHVDDANAKIVDLAKKKEEELMRI
jgi:ribosome recycling factor